MVTANQINEVVLDYLFHDDANRFLVEYSRLSYNIGERGDAVAIALVNKIETHLADVRAGVISRTAFKDALRNLSIPIYVSSTVTGSTFGFSSFPDWATGPLPLVLLANKQPA